MTPLLPSAFLLGLLGLPSLVFSTVTTIHSFPNTSYATIPSFPNTNIRNIVRYRNCSFHYLTQSVYACHEYSPEKTYKILSFQNIPHFNFWDQKVQQQIRNKTIVFQGDSLVINQFVSLACLLYEFDASIHSKRDMYRNDKLFRIYSPRLNFEIIHVTSFLLFPVHSVPEVYYPNKTLELEPEFVKAINGTFSPGGRLADMAIISTGHHYVIGRYNQSCAKTDSCSVLEWEKYEKALQTFNHLLNRTIKSDYFVNGRKDKPPMQIVWRSAPARHYSNGDWNTKGTCPASEPCWQDMAAHLQNPKSHFYKSQRKSLIIQKTAAEYNYSFLDISRNSMDRCDAHINTVKGSVGAALADCLHFCVPGAPDTWHDGLLKWL
jgi:hypothetical protein